MARKKTITKEQILAAAYEVAATEGFTRFTARNIANKSGSKVSKLNVAELLCGGIVMWRNC